MAKVVPADSMDTEYLRNTIGEALSQACAACALSQPSDPIDFLSSWLLQYAQNKAVRAGMQQEKREELEREKVEKDELERGRREALAKEEEKKSALERVAAISDDAWLLWRSALEVAQKHTGASAAYVAVLEEGPPVKEEGDEGDEEPEESPEEEEAEGEEAESAWYNVPEENPNPEKPAEEPEAEEKEEEQLEATENEEEKKPEGPDYASTQLWYTVALGGNEEAILGKKLTRSQGGVSFEVLDQKLPSLHVPNVLYKRGVHFFGGLPRLGALYVAPIPPPAAEKPIQTLLCADTLRRVRGGSGIPFPDEEQDFLMELAKAVARATNEGVAKSGEVAEKVKEQLTTMKGALYRIQEEQKAAAAQAAEEAEKEPEEEAEEGAEEGAEAPAAAAAPFTPLTRAQLALTHARTAHAAVTGALEAVCSNELARLRRAPNCSPTMLHVLQAAAAVLGREGQQDWLDWSKARDALNADFVKACQQHDPTGSVSTWTAVRRLIKEINGKALEGESPLTYILYRWVLSCKSVEVAHLLLQQAQQEADGAAAEKAREEAEAAAAAAAEAAEAKEEGDGEEEGDEEGADVDELANLRANDDNPGRTRSPTVI